MSDNLSTLIVNQSLTSELSISATNVSVEVPRFVTMIVMFESPSGEAINRSSLESTNTCLLSVTCNSSISVAEVHPPSISKVKSLLIGCNPLEASNSNSKSIDSPDSKVRLSRPLTTVIPFGSPLIDAVKSKSFVPSFEILTMIDEF